MYLVNHHVVFPFQLLNPNYIYDGESYSLSSGLSEHRSGEHLGTLKFIQRTQVFCGALGLGSILFHLLGEAGGRRAGAGRLAHWLLSHAVPPEFVIPLSEVTCEAGETVVLRCRVCGRPKASITWKGPEHNTLNNDGHYSISYR